MVRKARLRQLGFGLLLWMIVLTFTLAASMSVLAAPRPSGKNSLPPQKSVSHQFTAQQQRATLAYWTPARMESAIPIDTPVGPVHEQHQKAQAGTATTIAPFIPHGMHVAKPGKIHPDAYQLPQADYRYFPYSTIGKVFFTQNGLNYVCSGTSVNSNNKSVVDTAGHCVIAGGSGNHWSSNFMFCPQYYYGSCPYGEWAARQLWTLNYWASYGWLEEDYGDAVMSPNGYGDVVNVVGGTGSARNFSYNQYFYAFLRPQSWTEGAGTTRNRRSGTNISTSA